MKVIGRVGGTKQFDLELWHILISEIGFAMCVCTCLNGWMTLQRIIYNIAKFILSR
ncbi:hypothetical protein LX36DRAFT_649267 [Colletotrichum falcatum]|nr:hypothetical protein LX36DRAFT_649267 [Colletotrichum falcatum]